MYYSRTNFIIVIILIIIPTHALVPGQSSGTGAHKTRVQDINRKVPKAFDYATFVNKYHRSNMPLDSTLRANTFLARTVEMFKHNVQYVQGKVSHFLSQNDFSDMKSNEAKKIFEIEDDFGLKPVAGAEKWPNMPADQSPDVLNFKGDEGISYASLNDLKNGLENNRKTRLNFFEEEKIDPSHDIENIISDSPNFETAAKLVEHVQDFTREIHHKQKSRNHKDIPIKYIVKPDNRNFDSSEIVSYGYNDVPETMEWYKVDTSDFEDMLTPYPTPGQPDENTKSIMGSFLGTIKGLYDHFQSDSDMETPDDEDDQDSQELDVHPKISSLKVPDNNSIISNDNQIEYDIDWRETRCIPRVKSQSACNACYAFATLELMEFFYCQQKKQLTEFSVQFLLDCGLKTGLNGCRGGKISSVGQFIKKFGVQLNAFYPYEAQVHACRYELTRETRNKWYYLAPKINKWRTFPEMSAWYKWLPHSPIIVGVNMPADFLAYGGGIHEGTNCVAKMPHAMLLVGAGRQDGKEFWLLKNSFSTSWGEEGYFRLSKKAPLGCFHSAVVARIEFN